MDISPFAILFVFLGVADAFVVSRFVARPGCSSSHRKPVHLHANGIKNNKSVMDDDLAQNACTSSIDRRSALSQLLCVSGITAAAVGGINVQPSNAGEVGAKINAAVTQSDLGISVRRSVVKGAQFMDKLDGKWEKFSDDYGLGAERSKRDARPEEREVPPLLPLDKDSATSVLHAADSAFLSIVPVGEDVLRRQIEKVDSLVRKSFERAGLRLDGKDLDAEAFNYFAYIHFKAFNDILVERSVNFKQFRIKFENELGDELLKLLLPQAAASSETYGGTISADTLKDKLAAALVEVDGITETLRAKGFVALVERSQIDAEKLADWSEDLSDLQFSIALDKDATQNSQILLGEQGYRLVPDFARYAITSSLRNYLSPLKEEVTTEEYYMDTSYASDPDLFEVKQVLLNVVIESI